MRIGGVLPPSFYWYLCLLQMPHDVQAELHLQLLQWRSQADRCWNNRVLSLDVEMQYARHIKLSWK